MLRRSNPEPMATMLDPIDPAAAAELVRGAWRLAAEPGADRYCWTLEDGGVFILEAVYLAWGGRWIVLGDVAGEARYVETTAEIAALGLSLIAFAGGRHHERLGRNAARRRKRAEKAGKPKRGRGRPRNADMEMLAFLARAARDHLGIKLADSARKAGVEPAALRKAVERLEKSERDRRRREA